MKKIICTVTNDLNFDQRMIRICTSLSNAGYDVLLVGRQLPHSPVLQKQPFQQKRFSLFSNKGKLFYLEYNIRLFFFLLINRFDAVCSVDLDSLMPGFLVAKLKKKVCVYDAHEYFTEVPELVDRPNVKRIWESMAYFLIPKLTFAYTVCESLAEIFQQKYGVHFNVIRNVPTAKPIPSRHVRGGDSFILIYQGVLNDGRGLEEAVGAMELLEGVELWLAGEGDLSGFLRKMVQEKRLENKVVFYGRVSPDELHSLTIQAHLGLNLLKNKGLNYYYSLANKTFDYMQAGIPSICMAFPEYKKLYRQTKAIVLLEELSEKQIADAVKTLKNNSRQFEEMCERNREAAAEWVWEKEEKKLLHFYTALWS